MKIAILGSGRMGGALGTIWAKAGHSVTFAYSRSSRKLEDLAKATNGRAESPADAAKEADAVLIAVHWSRIDDVLGKAGSLDGKVVVNCCIPLDEEDRDLVLGTTTSGAEELGRRLPEARLVCAFNTCPSEALSAVFAKRDSSPRPQLLYYGDDPAAKEVARQLIEDTGYEPLEAGALRTARFVEPFAMVTAELAYGGSGGAELVYRFDRLS